VVHEVVQAVRPCIFKLHQDVHQLDIVLQLRVNNLDILFVLLEQFPEIKESFLDSVCEDSHSFRLMRTHPSEYSFRGQENVVAQVISSHSLRVGHRVDLSKDLDKLCAAGVVFWGIDHYPASCFFSELNVG